MRLTSLIAGALAFACAALAQAGTPITPRVAQAIDGCPKCNGAYRVSDDPKGLASGSKYRNVTAVVVRGGVREGGDVHDLTIDNVHFTLKADQTGSALPAGGEIQGTAHDVLISNSSATNFRMACDPKHYCNGDAWSTEAGVYRVTFRNVLGQGATDGCFDLKGQVRLEDVIAQDCNRLLRVWNTVTGTTVTLANPNHRGGIGGAAVVWMEHYASLTLDKLVVRATSPGTLFDCDGGHDCTITLGAYDFDVPAGMRIAKGVTVNWGPQGAPDLTKPVKTAPPPPPVMISAPAVPAPAYDYTSQAPIPDGNHDGFVTVATDPVLLKLFPKGTVLKLVASDASGFHYKRQP